MKAPDFPCPRCGEPQEALEVTSLADMAAGERHWIQGMPCQCPRPRCTFCLAPLPDDGRCDNVGCWFVGNLVPVPVMA